MDYCFEDFTETNYRKIIRMAKKVYKFISYEEAEDNGRNVLWRHDIDYSVHRALKLAQIEYEEGIKSTYFIYLHSDSYNALEKEVADRIHKIVGLGHEIGVHFEPNFYGLVNSNMRRLEEYLKMEKSILEEVFEKKIWAFSFHNPDTGDWLKLDQYTMAGLINAYSKTIKHKYSYCSDSNGYWRFRRLEEVIKAAEDEKLQVLTHPEWWTPEVLSPRNRILRSITGRAQNQIKEYDNLLQKMGRENIR